MYTEEQIQYIEDVKSKLQIDIDKLKNAGIRKENIEIELFHFMKRAIYPEKYEF